MRFAIWSAVSTASQVEGESLDEQERKCRALASSKGWQDSLLVYRIEGQSRSNYINLRDAERDLPPLAALLNAAQSGSFDLLLAWDYNRFRDLADPIARTLAAYGVQIYSVNQPIEPADPASFDPYSTDSEGMMRGLNAIISKWQISDLQRKYKFGMKGRIERGLYGLKFPFGYIQSRPGDRQSPLIVDPIPASLLIQMKDAFLKGASLAELERIADASRIPTPRGHKHWRRATIYTMLINPFYAGITAFGGVRIQRDPRTRKRKEIKNAQPLHQNTGTHPPLWDYPTHLALLQETHRRSAHDPRRTFTPLSGLLTCSVCNAKLWRHVSTYYCNRRETGHHTHVILLHAEAMTDIPRQLADFLRRFTPDLKADTPPPDPSLLLADLTRKRTRVTEGYEAGLYDLRTAKEKLTAIDSHIAALHDQQLQHTQRQTERAQLTQHILDLQSILDDLPAWFLSDDPHKVNYLLRHLLSHITVTPDHHYTFHLLGE